MVLEVNPLHQGYVGAKCTDRRDSGKSVPASVTLEVRKGDRAE